MYLQIIQYNKQIFLNLRHNNYLQKNFKNKNNIYKSKQKLKQKIQPFKNSNINKRIQQIYIFFLHTKSNLQQSKNQEFVFMAKINNFQQCLQLLDKINNEIQSDINSVDEDLNTALHYASLNGNTEFVSLLLYYEAIIDPQNINLQTPLILAAKQGYDEIVQLLLNAGAEINQFDEYQNGAIHYASMNGHKKLIELLLKKSSLNIQKKNKQNQDAYQLASNQSIQKIFETFFYSQINQFQNQQKLIIHQIPEQQMQLQNQQYLSQNQQLQYQQNQQLSQSNQQIKQQNQQMQQLTMQLQQQNLQLQQQNSYQFLQNQQIQQQNLQPQELIQVKVKNNIMHIFINLNEKKKKINSIENDNKSSINEKTSTSDESKSSFGTEEEKVGPQNFYIHGLIGKGSFGEVYLVEKKGSMNLFAMKVLLKSHVQSKKNKNKNITAKNQIKKKGNNLIKYALTERNVMSLSNHPFLVKLNYAFQTNDRLFLIMDYCPGGDLGELLQKEKKIPEPVVKIYLAEIILALENLHQRDIIFRDLKPDNVVLDYEGHIKLTDFGLSKEGVLEHITGAKSFCGSVAYLAPEMIKKCGHGKAVDWYLLGVIMYELLVGVPPYYANNREELFENIQKAPLKIPSYLSQEARSLLKSLLQRNPAKRLGSGKGDAQEIKAHPFFNDLSWEDAYNSNQISGWTFFRN
ncbi:protein kinase domain protein [Ichthyophthirius multifiliis]|uniref:Protein kinase domain protein n=1 Tax=Ichthyophthirius multifiliis TaxID=5932 RepID=G0QN71_ICHMU|nr:protein kinase domain protein [Ichthyophthirius multifiliis]EGR33343.1 protein kinase domain protein [Ichthyophthirius multifiliis]|eukprot:XP_004037329.1 protein kinase domain protein [Ichthyophthirius multifiliis]